MGNKIYTALGLMSGTSMDGIDAAIITTDGHSVSDIIGGNTFPYTDAFRQKLRNLIHGKGNRKETEYQLTLLHADACFGLLSQLNQAPSNIDFIGFHGHTIDHRPHEGITIQIGDGELLRKLTGIKVVYDFRTADVKAGGQGAPLVPIYHQALLAKEEKPVAVVNIGGVANVTWIGNKENELLAFDTGPGNALLDDWVHGKTGQSCDHNGALARQGKIDHTLLSHWMQDAFFSAPPPKSLDRNHFAGITGSTLSLEDGAATLAALTTHSIVAAAKFFPEKVAKWLVTGGGRHNAAIMRGLRDLLDAPVLNINECGYNGDLLEAQAFAFLAVRSVLNLPYTFPGTTGIKAPACGGLLSFDSNANDKR